MDTIYERGSSVLFLDKDDKWSRPAEKEAADEANLVPKLIYMKRMNFLHVV